MPLCQAHFWKANSSVMLKGPVFPVRRSTDVATITRTTTSAKWIDAFVEDEGIGPLEVRYTNEFGFTFGTTPKYKLWIIPLPRIGLGYRFGPHLKGWRINFGFPF